MYMEKAISQATHWIEASLWYASPTLWILCLGKLSFCKYVLCFQSWFDLFHQMQDIRHFLLILPPNALDLVILIRKRSPLVWRSLPKVEEDDNFRRELSTALQLDANIVPVTDNFQWPEPDSLPEVGSGKVCSIIFFRFTQLHGYRKDCLIIAQLRT